MKISDSKSIFKDLFLLYANDWKFLIKIPFMNYLEMNKRARSFLKKKTLLKDI